MQSSLAPASPHAEWTSQLFWWMAAGTLVITALVIALTFVCVRARADRHTSRRDAALIIGGGVLVPVVVLTALLIYGLAMLPPLVARAPEGSLRVMVIGEQWWWRVRYFPAAGEAIDLANEIRLAAGEPVQLQLASDNVIHSFWVPSLAGKIDMIPGRLTHLALHPAQTGVFRGTCAEYCGASHALMSFYVETVDRREFDRWLEQQRAPARAPTEPEAIHGRELFLSTGCGACHRIAGTSADGVIGPDLTHVGSRRSLAAGMLPNDADAFARWIARPEAIKPGAHMPSFGMLPQEQVRAIAAYLESLE